MADYTPAFEIDDPYKVQKDYFKKFIRYEDNTVSFNVNNGNNPGITPEPENIIENLKMHIVYLDSINFVQEEAQGDVDVEYPKYIAQINHFLDAKIVGIQCEVNNKSVMVDYEIVDKDTIKIKTLDPVTMTVIILYEDKTVQLPVETPVEEDVVEDSII